MLKRYPGIIKQSHSNSVFSSYFCVSSSFSALMMQFHLCSHLCAWSSAHPTQTLSGHTCWKVGQEQFQNQMTVKAGTVPTTSTSEKKKGIHVVRTLFGSYLQQCCACIPFPLVLDLLGLRPSNLRLDTLWAWSWLGLVLQHLKTDVKSSYFHLNSRHKVYLVQ